MRGEVRTDAWETLKQFQEKNLPHFLLSLTVELANDQNSLDVKDSSKKEELAQRWVSIDPSIKGQIKESLLHNLGSSVSEARHTSSQVIAKVACSEIPRQGWKNLIEQLLINMKHQGAPESLKQATLETLGYICEEVSYKELQKKVNDALTTMVQGMTHLARAHL